MIPWYNRMCIIYLQFFCWSSIYLTQALKKLEIKDLPAGGSEKHTWISEGMPFTLLCNTFQIHRLVQTWLLLPPPPPDPLHPLDVSSNVASSTTTITTHDCIGASAVHAQAPAFFSAGSDLSIQLRSRGLKEEGRDTLCSQKGSIPL